MFLEGFQPKKCSSFVLIFYETFQHVKDKLGIKNILILLLRNIKLFTLMELPVISQKMTQYSGHSFTRKFLKEI